MEPKQTNDKNRARRRLVIESILALAIVLSPFIFKMHEYVSEDPEATLTILGFTIDNNGFPNINIYIWFLLGKIVPLYLLMIWFFTCKHWWYHIILIPILMYAFQIFEVVYSEDKWVDTENLLWLLPFCMVVIPFVYFIRIRLYDKYVHGIDLEAMNIELQAYREKDRLERERMGLDPLEEDLSSKTPNKILDGIGKGFQELFKDLFSPKVKT